MFVWLLRVLVWGGGSPPNSLQNRQQRVQPTNDGQDLRLVAGLPASLPNGPFCGPGDSRDGSRSQTWTRVKRDHKRRPVERVGPRAFLEPVQGPQTPTGAGLVSDRVVSSRQGTRSCVSWEGGQRDTPEVDRVRLSKRGGEPLEAPEVVRGRWRRKELTRKLCFRCTKCFIRRKQTSVTSTWWEGRGGSQQVRIVPSVCGGSEQARRALCEGRPCGGTPSGQMGLGVLSCAQLPS